jgi:hypothetical protein
MDQRIGSGRIGHPQQRFGEAHQGNALVRAKAIGLQECIKSASLVRPRALDQSRRDTAGLLMRRTGR